jgi:hypothetical protein
MRLADHMLAAAGTLYDLGGFATFMRPYIKSAERFEVADDVARAAGDLVYSRPSCLAAALPLCRLPYETLWIEYRGGLGPKQGRRTFDSAPVPCKQGVLIESMPGGQTGFMTVAWLHKPDNGDEDMPGPAVNISPISIYFDWREDGDVRSIVRQAHDAIIKAIPHEHGRQLVEFYREAIEKKWVNYANTDAIQHLFTGSRAWDKFVGNAREIEAMMVLDRHAMPGISPHGAGLIAFILSRVTPSEVLEFMLKWEADVQGEGAWVQCFLAMLNTKNPCVEHEAVDITRLNKSRRKLGRTEFLPYRRTRLALSRSQARIATARGIDREAARAHLVRGHFKIRATGVFWWSSFLRGDAAKGSAMREEYIIGVTEREHPKDEQVRR